MEKKGRQAESNARTRLARRAERAENHFFFRMLMLLLLVVVAFCGGFVLRSQTALVASWGIPVSEEEHEALNNAASISAVDDSVSARVGDVERILSTYSMDTVDLTKATYSLLDDLMKSTGDPYATYYDPDLYNAYVKETSDRSYAGIGVVFADYNGRAYAADVFEGSEAEAKGVQQGDFLKSIDGVNVSDWSMTEVVNALSKDEGTNVSITWMRPTSLDAQTGEDFTTTLVCKVYEEANLSTEMSGEVGIIRIRQITQNSSDLVKTAVEVLAGQGAKAFVLDLRNNPGGYLTQAVDIASLFIQSGVIVNIETKEGTTPKNASGGPVVTEAPMVVLVNKYTAAAAEVLAAALLDNQRADVIGETTMGKGSVQVVRELEFGGAVRYTAAYYLSPLGQPIDGVGVVPQTAISNGDADNEADAQMLAALDVARSLVPPAV